MADADSTQIVSLTVTEKGYCHNVVTRDLDIDHPLIQHDLDPANAGNPKYVACAREQFVTDASPATHYSMLLLNVIQQFSLCYTRAAYTDQLMTALCTA